MSIAIEDLVGSLSLNLVADNNGNVGIGTKSPSAPLSVIPSSSTSPNYNGIYVYNPNTSGTENAIVAIRTNGSSGGDPYISFDVNGGIGWSVGLDNSDGDSFKITNVWNGVSSGVLRFKLNNYNRTSCVIPERGIRMYLSVSEMMRRL